MNVITIQSTSRKDTGVAQDTDWELINAILKQDKITFNQPYWENKSTLLR